ncbi:MAG TPA: cyclic pyranopterin monophosphate synthase MoaC [Candidatus Eremiobacteraceae bacterium]|nr:cyclic pyranopterin monophosphate synthase MoaC [Candidatus Eremiobacteraceae bacterium]
MAAKRTRASTRPAKLTHVRANGSIRMVDVGAKSSTNRRAVAEASVLMSPPTLRMILQHTAKKGDVFAAAQIAGIQAAKKTAELIPLCHSVPLTHVEVEFAPQSGKRINVRCAATCSGQTGVEMEALVGAAIAALTIYDMCKAADRGVSIEQLRLVEKSGGRSGHYRRGDS